MPYSKRVEKIPDAIKITIPLLDAIDIQGKDVSADALLTQRKLADPQRVLKVNREHWTIENSCHYILDWNYDEDRSHIRTGHGPENITRLRRFAIGVIKSKGVRSVAQRGNRISKRPIGLRSDRNGIGRIVYYRNQDQAETYRTATLYTGV